MVGGLDWSVWKGMGGVKVWSVGGLGKIWWEVLERYGRS